MAKYIFVTGGVVSSLGKGIGASSIGCLLESRGLRVTLQKFDPYLNVDPGTMSPFQHGEVFVTDDGAETDLDLGHYERFTHSNLTQANNVTSGRIYERIIAKERRGDYLGKTVQVIPHVTNEIKAAIHKVSAEVDVVIVEIGGTVGDIESLPFLEAIRQMRHEHGRDNTLYVHVTLVPWIAAAHELKTKPTQHSVKELREIGIQPDMLLCRSEHYLPQEVREKIALFCDVNVDAVITARDVESVYEVPLIFAEQGVDEIILRQLRLEAAPRDLDRWKDMVWRLKNPEREVDIALVGKYVQYEDSYKSLKEALLHGGLEHRARVNIHWLESEHMLDGGAGRLLGSFDGILVPGGFGHRGVEGMIEAIRFARERQVPFFGICLACKPWSLSLREMFAACRRPTPPSLIRLPRIALFTNCASLPESTRWAAPCGWALIPASWPRAASRTRRMEPGSSTNATATVMSLIASSSRSSPGTECASPDGRPTGFT